RNLGSRSDVGPLTFTSGHVYQKEGVYSLQVSVGLIPADQDPYQQGVPIDNTNQLASSQLQATIAYSSNAHFIMQLYNDLLGRNAETTGRQAWTAKLDAGSGRDQVVRSIEASPEYRTKLLTDYYASILGRVPDAVG